MASPTASERIVHLDRLTSREVGEWLKTSDAIFVPHGPVSGHGPWTTLGMHPHAAEAIAVLLARKCNGLVYPTIYTAFAGATRLYPGTVPFSYEFHITVLKTVARALHAQGFGRIFLVAFTHPTPETEPGRPRLERVSPRELVHAEVVIVAAQPRIGRPHGHGSIPYDLGDDR